MLTISLSLFSIYMYNICGNILDVKTCTNSLIFLSFSPLVLSPPLFILRRVLPFYKGYCPGAYYFDEISATEFDFENY